MSPSTFGTIKTFFENEIIFEIGQPGNHGFLIKGGEVTIYRVVGNEKKILNVLSPGEVFGEMAIIDQAPRSANAIASKYCELVVIDKQTLFRLLNESPKIIQSITHVLIKRLMNLTEMVSRKTNPEISDEQKFTRICRLIHLAIKSADTTSAGLLDYNEFCGNAIDIIGVSRSDIDYTIKNLSLLKQLEITGDLTDKSNSKIKVTRPDEFLEVVKNASAAFLEEGSLFQSSLDYHYVL